MSRGLGNTQEAVLTYLRTNPTGRWEGGQRWTYKRDIIAALTDGKPTQADKVSIRRAIRTLAARGVVESSYHQVRLMPTPDEQVEYEKGWNALVSAGRSLSVS